MRSLRRNTVIGAAIAVLASGCASAPKPETQAGADAPQRLVETVGPEGETLERVSDGANGESTTGPEPAPVGTENLDQRWVCSNEPAFAGLIHREVCHRPIELKSRDAMSAFLVKKATRPGPRY